MIAHNNYRGRIPLILLFEKMPDMGEVLVSESEIVDIRGVRGAENLLFAIVEAVRMRDGHVEKQEVDVGVGEKGVPRDSEAGVVA